MTSYDAVAKARSVCDELNRVERSGSKFRVTFVDDGSGWAVPTVCTSIPSAEALLEYFRRTAPGLRPGDVVVYTPPGSPNPASPEAPRLVVVGLFEDGEQYAWVADVRETVNARPEVTAELVGDLTKVDS